MRYLIIGGSAAGTAAVESIRKIDKKGQITLVSAEGFYPYSRCLISRFVDGRLSQEGLYFKTRDFFKEWDVDGLLATEVKKIDRDAQKVVLGKNKELPYDKLLLATGTRSRFPKIEGVNLKGVYSFHSLKDASLVKEAVVGLKDAVVIGGGFVGLEAAYALARRKLKVTVIERCSQILPNQMDAIASGIIQKDLEGLGVDFILNETAAAINGNAKVEGVTVSNQVYIPAGMVILATGTSVNKELAQEADLATENGILANEFLQTSDPNIYAAGDCIEIQDITSGKRVISATWFNAVLQGKFAGSNMAGLSRRYTMGVGIQNAVQFHQIPAISYGLVMLDAQDSHRDYEVVAIRQERCYKKLVIRDSRLCGMIFVGDISKAGFYSALIREGVDISKYKSKLLDSDFSHSYFKDQDFNENTSYKKISPCWDSQYWWKEKVRCMGI
jgi:nitrite reductase (NADH) large subunit